MLKQLSVIVENEPGSLARVTHILKENTINIRAISTFDSPEYSILRLVLDKADEAKQILRGKGYSVTTSEVISVELMDQPGDLDRVLQILADASINVNYIYSFVLRKKDEPLMVINVDKMQEAEEILKQNQVKVIDCIN
ncbi:ACT domain-containing protein [Anaerolentibacter hominis]|uniref:ACT domain-containing protein n=1 Tax=Anaerolentibacter hominis TaxID=3079009 RepID=UPI0031B83521